MSSPKGREWGGGRFSASECGGGERRGDGKTGDIEGRGEVRRQKKAMIKSIDGRRMREWGRREGGGGEGEAEDVDINCIAFVIFWSIYLPRYLFLCDVARESRIQMMSLYSFHTNFHHQVRSHIYSHDGLLLHQMDN